LENRNVELSEANNDLSNLLNNVNIPVVILGDDMRIRRFTPQAEAAMNLIATDIGRPLTDIKLNIDVPDVEPLVRRVIGSLTVEEREVQDRAGRWYLLRIRPYRTMENRIDGAVLALVDIDALKQGLQQIKDARSSMRSLGQLIREPLLVLDKNLRVQIANQPFAQLSLTPAEEVEGKLLYGLGEGQWNMEHLRVVMDELLSKSHQFVDFEIKTVFPKVGARVLSLDARRVTDNNNETQLILLVFKEKRKS
jgi:two-component system CheB/CheR fusion protein